MKANAVVGVDAVGPLKSQMLLSIAVWIPVATSLCVFAQATLAQSNSDCLVPPQAISAIFETYCFDCHGEGTSEGDLSLDRLPGAAANEKGSSLESLKSWLDIEQELVSGRMPPEDAQALPASQRAELTGWLNAALTRAVRNQQSVERPRFRRLTNIEYANTMRDLLGFDMDFTSELPADSRSGDGFANNPTALLVSTEHLQAYLKTARTALDKVIVSGPPPKKLQHTFTESDIVRWDKGREFSNRLGRNSLFIAKIEKEYPEQGEFAIRVKFSAELPPAVGPPILQVDVGYRPDTQILFRTLAEVEIDEPTSQMLEFRGRIENFPLPVRGQGKYPGLQIKLCNVYDDRSPLPEPVQRDAQNRPLSYPDEPQLPHIVIESVEFETLPDETWPPRSHREILFDSPLRASDPSAYVKQILAKFVPRAFRRPIEPSELDSFVQLHDRNLDRFPDLESAIRETLAMVLIHPSFLYLGDRDASPAARDHRLASRLSYFLWSTMPDDELCGASHQRRLHEPLELQRQVERMLRDERSMQLVTHFVDQWLELDRMINITVDDELYPGFDPSLKAHMRAETHRFFRELLDNNLSALNLLESDFGVFNESMARHYGIDGVLGRQFRRVPITADSHRGGVLTQAGILLANSTGRESHPVRRAVWVRDRLLNDPPASPPADVPTLDQIDPNFASLPIRQQLEIHRTAESCNQCHRTLDPWGLALENFDAVGAWHDQATDARAELPGDIPLRNLSDLQEHLLQSCPERFGRSLVVRLLSYALGRELDVYDRPLIGQLSTSFAEHGYRIRDLVIAIAHTTEFQDQ